MKFSSWLALGALIGRRTSPAKTSWKDYALGAIIAKNECLDKDGEVRKLVEKGVSDNELEELERMRQEEMENLESTPRKRKKITKFGSFMKGLRGEKL